MNVSTHSFNKSSEASSRGFLILQRNADVERMEGLPRILPSWKVAELAFKV